MGEGKEMMKLGLQGIWIGPKKLREMGKNVMKHFEVMGGENIKGYENESSIIGQSQGEIQEKQ